MGDTVNKVDKEYPDTILDRYGLSPKKQYDIRTSFGKWDSDEKFYRVTVTEYFYGRDGRLILLEKKFESISPIKAMAFRLFRMAVEYCEQYNPHSENVLKVTLKSTTETVMAIEVTRGRITMEDYQKILHEDNVEVSKAIRIHRHMPHRCTAPLKLSRTTIAEIRRYYRRGASFAYISDNYHVSNYTIRRILDDYDDRGEYIRDDIPEQD